MFVGGRSVKGALKMNQTADNLITFPYQFTTTTPSLWRMAAPASSHEAQPSSNLGPEVEKSSPTSVADANAESDAYSIFTRSEKRWIVLLVAYAGLFSPLSSFIYYPALYPLSQDLGITLEMANLSITSYMIVSGIAPSLLGDMADSLGRRPLYLGAISAYLIANIGLALQRSYPALIILRMLQSAGSSGKQHSSHGSDAPHLHVRCVFT